MKALIVAPHPDDEVLGCGGVIARHAAEGDEVHVLVVSRGIAKIFPPEQIELTRDELREAHKVLRVTGTSFLEFPAPKLDAIPGYELADAIVRVMDLTKPEVMYLPHRSDLHADHQAVYLAGLVAARPINGCTVKKVLCYETLSETEWASPHADAVFAPTVFVDIGEHLETKISALTCIASQMKDPPHPRSLDVVRALARLRGSMAGLMAAEAFMLVREIR